MDSEEITTPGALIGYRRNGLPIYLAAGGAEPDAEDDETEEETEDDKSDDGDESKLGDAGKRALDSMKAKLKEERTKRRAAEARLAEGAKPAADKDEVDIEKIKADARKEVMSAANAKALRAEVMAVAAGMLADPHDAAVMLDLKQFDLDDDGNADTEEIAEAIAELLTKKPYLAMNAQGGKRQGSADGGVRKGSKPGQLTRSDLKGKSPEQIATALASGQLNDLLGSAKS